MDDFVFFGCAADFSIYILPGSTGFSSPFYGYPVAESASFICLTTTTTTISDGPCPAGRVLGEDNTELENLRDFRDSSLANSIIGRQVINIYYSNAESINRALERSPTLRAMTRRVLKLIAPMVGDEE